MSEGRRADRQEWTARQREVLDLLARGRTNPEIAAALGISLAGAKWHVSELISRLGVESREEVARYWREQQRPAARVQRRLSSLPALSVLVKAPAFGAAMAVGIIATVALVFAFRDGEEEDSNGVQLAETSGFAIRVDSVESSLAVTAISISIVGREDLSPLEIQPARAWITDSAGRTTVLRSRDDSGRAVTYSFDGSTTVSSGSASLTVESLQFRTVLGSRFKFDSNVSIPIYVPLPGEAATVVELDRVEPWSFASIRITSVEQAGTTVNVRGRLEGFSGSQLQALGFARDAILAMASGATGNFVLGRSGYGEGLADFDIQYEVPPGEVPASFTVTMDFSFNPGMTELTQSERDQASAAIGSTATISLIPDP